MKDADIQQSTSSPYYAESNGLAESMVKVAKASMKKAVKDGKAWHEGLLDYRTTPQHPNMPSPAELFFGRKIFNYS